jgi:hypothetical protein
MNRKAKALVLMVMAVGALAAWRFAFAGQTAVELDQAIDRTRPRVELSFEYVRQDGKASNQIAAWVTDKDGGMVKTLFATNFTAGRGGWEFRAESLPQWVADSGIARMDKSQVDAISRATPNSGTVRYAWYGDDANGKPVPAGSYIINLEATLRGENRALYQTPVLLGGDGTEEKVEPVFFGSGTAERGMVTNVAVRYRP